MKRIKQKKSMLDNPLAWILIAIAVLAIILFIVGRLSGGISRMFDWFG